MRWLDEQTDLVIRAVLSKRVYFKMVGHKLEESWRQLLVEKFSGLFLTRIVLLFNLGISTISLFIRLAEVGLKSFSVWTTNIVSWPLHRQQWTSKSVPKACAGECEVHTVNYFEWPLKMCFFDLTDKFFKSKRLYSSDPRRLSCR